MKKIIINLCLAVLFCFNGLAQQNPVQSEKLKDLLKGLKKGNMEQNYEVNMEQTPIYNLEGERIKPTDAIKYFSANPPSHAVDIYVDADDKLALLLMRPIKEEEKMNIQQKMGKAKEEMEGEKAPIFSVKSIEGKSFDLKKLKGKIVVLNFWFTTCMPCVLEMPELNKIVQKYKNNKDIVFLGFALDSKKQIEAFLQTNPFKYNLVEKSNTIAKRYKVSAYPTHIVIDKKGNIALYRMGGHPIILNQIEEKLQDLATAKKL